MHIPLHLVVPTRDLKDVSTFALIDSGADVSCIDWHFVNKHNLPKERLPQPIPVRNVDQSTNKNGDIKFTCSLYIRIAGLLQQVKFYVMHCGKENIILGLPWLQKINPVIDWAKKTVTIRTSCDEADELNALYNQDHLRHVAKLRPPPPTAKAIRHIDSDPVHDGRLYDYLDNWAGHRFPTQARTHYLINRVIKCGQRFAQIPSTMVKAFTTATKLAIDADNVANHG